MRKIFSLVIISFLLLNALLIMATINPVESKFLDNMGNPNDGDRRTIVLDGEGELFDGTTYFDVPLGQGSVMDASLNISVLEYGENYPLNPNVNVGLDLDIEWEYSGTGIGSMGYQKYFHDGSTKRTISFSNPTGGTDASSVVKIPKNANVKTADISMKGRFSKPDFSEYNFTTDVGYPHARAVELGDINGDSWLDAVAPSESLGSVVWYENDQTPKNSEWEKTTINNSLTMAWAVALADIDNDNDLDVVATSNDQKNQFGVYWYENVNTTNNLQPGNGSAWWGHRIDNSSNFVSNPQSVKVADIDNDGDNDTIVGGYNQNSGGVFWFENTMGDGSSWQNHTIYQDPTKNCDVSDIDVGNINHTASGRLDVVATIYSRDLVVWFENDGNPENLQGNWRMRTIDSVSVNNYRYPWKIVIADMNADSDNDVVVGYQVSYGVRWFKAPTGITTATSWGTNYYVSWLSYVGDIAVAKINSDNYVDIAATSYNWDYIYYFRNNNAAGTSWSTYSIEYDFQGAMGIAVANIDKDSNGRDIAVTGYNCAEIRWYRNQGGTYSTFY
jgi:hypothetical protein